MPPEGLHFLNTHKIIIGTSRGPGEGEAGTGGEERGGETQAETRGRAPLPSSPDPSPNTHTQRVIFRLILASSGQDSSFVLVPSPVRLKLMEEVLMSPMGQHKHGANLQLRREAGGRTWARLQASVRMQPLLEKRRKESGHKCPSLEGLEEHLSGAEVLKQEARTLS